MSGSRSPTRPPATNTDDASRMGMALVMPTSEPKIRLPSTAASLHKALQKPKPVPLETTDGGEKNTPPSTKTKAIFLIRGGKKNGPSVRRVQLSGDHIQRVPGGDAEAVVEAEHEDHHRLAGSEPQEEAADARQHHGAPCRTQQELQTELQTERNIKHPAKRKKKAAAPMTSYPAC